MTENQTSPWHALPVDRIIERLATSRGGLSTQEACRRFEQHGANEIPSAQQVSPWKILASQFKNLLIVILLIATLISAFLGQPVEAIAIAVIVCFAILLGFLQEYRAERAIAALKKLAAPTAIVLRDGQEEQIAARELVPGDVLLLAAGDRVPGDARLMEAINVMLDESSLTGESLPVEKRSEELPGEAMLADRSNMLYAGTALTHGRARALVVATGTNTELGKIRSLLEAVEARKTPLQENLDRVGKALALAALVVVSLIVSVALVRGAPLIEMLVFGLALAVAVVPEALPAVVTISLAIGVQRMVKHHALIRHLSTVETLGSTSVICCDKTGTLTKGEMTARAVFLDDRRIEISGTGYEPLGTFCCDGQPIEDPALLTELLRGAGLASDARLTQTDGRWAIKGDPTEGALIVAAAKAGLEKEALERNYPRVDEIQFSSERKRMTTIHERPDGAIAYSKGAPELILDSCVKALTAQGERSLDGVAVERIRNAAKGMAAEGLRVLGLASKRSADKADAEHDMVFLGLIGMMDAPRPEARRAIQTCEQAGIKPIMITGDHPLTAQAVARELTLLKDGRVVSGAEIDAMSEAELAQEVGAIEVYARVAPEHKLRVVEAWQKRGCIVAMTGDGVNDAPALKRADVGIAMGLTGTDISKEAADMMLADDNFASIVGAVEEGRVIFGNIKKYLMFLLSSNIGEIGLMAGAAAAGLPLPLTAVQILYVNLATDGLPALALSIDPPEEDLMRRPPRDPRRGIFTRPVLTLMLAGGIWSSVVNLGLFTWALASGRGLEHAMTLSFVALVLTEFFKAYGFRSERQSVLNKPFANGWLNLAIVWELLLLSLIVYLPFLQGVFRTHTLSLADWGAVIIVAASVLPVLELGKWGVRRGWLGQTG
ncbi:MAG: cation-translocating P-type ATPase [Gammaproteobacteria bacterium]